MSTETLHTERPSVAAPPVVDAYFVGQLGSHAIAGLALAVAGTLIALSFGRSMATMEIPA
jgi:hypothetical protein